MEKKKEELSIKLDKISRVYFFAQDAYLYTEYFHNPETDEELQLIINSPHSRELSMIMHLMFRTLIVELSKLFSRSANDKFQLEKFIKSLSPEGHFSEIGVSQEIMNSWIERIKGNKEIINDILVLRDKIYAHTDNPIATYKEIDISFKKIKVLLDIAKDILTSIYGTVFDVGLTANSPTFDRGRFILLKLLAKAEAQRVQEIFEKYRNWRTE
jgi:hypothetical protein